MDKSIHESVYLQEEAASDGPIIASGRAPPN